MSKHVAISSTQAADRLALRELVEAYAHCADRRDAKGQMSLFTAETHFVVYMNAKESKPSMEPHSCEALASIFSDLKKYRATTHFLGQSRIFTLTGDRATGESYCLAHHVNVDVTGLTTEADWRSWQAAEFMPYLRHALASFGPNRLMFGSDWPVMTLATDYERWIETVRTQLPLSNEEDWEQLFHTNAEMIYRV